MPDITGDEREIKIDPEQALEWGDIAIAGVNDKSEEVIEEESVAEEESDEEIDDEEVIEEQYEEPPAIDLPDDPGDFTPNDYSFIVETLDGTKTKITNPDQAEEFINENADNLSAAQQMSLMRKTTAMESNMAKDKALYEKQKAEYDSIKQESDARQETINNIAAEINYLVSKGKLPQVDEKYMNTDWADPLVSKQAGVREQVALLNYMRDENDARIKAGLKPLTSIIDAYNSMELEKRDNGDVDVKKQRAVARREAGARVAGNSPKPVNVAPKGISVGRVLDDSAFDSF